MKIRNYYAWICAIWLVSSFTDCIFSIVNFVDGNMGSGLLFLVLSVAFAFVCGMLLEKSLSIYRHNKTCDWLSEIAEEIIEQDKELPFGEFKKEN